MKPAMIRTMDSQGRIIIPHEIRRTMNLSGGDTIEIRTVENGVLLSKYKSASAGDRSMKKYLNILYSVTRCGAAICTEDQVIVSKGLYVMVHAGFAIEKMSEKEALENLQLLEEIKDAL